MRRERGVALLIALLVVALATILIAGLLDRGQLTAARTRNQLREQQAEDYAKGLEDYAARVLRQDDQSPDHVDASDDMWAVPLPPSPVPGGDITATMTDLDGRFNLNNLADDNTQHQAWEAKFVLLLQALKLDTNLARNVSDWMSRDPSAGANEAWYLGQAVPYRPAKRKFEHVSELRMVQGFDGDTYARILPYVSALPIPTQININTAPVPVLMTLTDPLMTEQAAAAIWQQGHAHFSSFDQLRQSPYNVFGITQGMYGFQSSFFLARGDITLDGLPFTFYSLIQRSLGNGAGANGGVFVLQRSRGGE